MGRPRNPRGSGPLTITVVPRLRAWLDELATYAVYGKTGTAVAEHFILEGVNRELRGEGLLKNPPPKPRKGART
jgi:hypothetical protein